MSEVRRSLPDRRGFGRRITALAVTAGFLFAAGAGVFSAGASAASAPQEPSSVTITVSGACALERVGTQFVKCDNLTGAGVRAPSYVRQVQRMGIGDHR